MSKTDLILNFALLNAAGSLGFAPEAHGPFDLTRIGAFVTNPISRVARSPANGPRMLSFAGGFLLHTGHPNPGLRAVLRQYAGRWARSPLPVLVHLLGESEEAVANMVRRLEIVEGVMGVELSLPPDISAGMASAMLRAACGELPVIVRLPFHRSEELAEVAARCGAAAVSLGPPRGALPGPDGEIVEGRLYGPALLPLALGTVRNLARAPLPVIGAGGIYSEEDVKAMLAAGAAAVQLDAILWRGNWLG